MLGTLPGGVTGIFFGKEALAGLLPGAMVSGVQIAISASNTGGAWDNAKKYIEAGKMGKERGKGSEVPFPTQLSARLGHPPPSPPICLSERGGYWRVPTQPVFFLRRTARL